MVANSARTDCMLQLVCMPMQALQGRVADRSPVPWSLQSPPPDIYMNGLAWSSVWRCKCPLARWIHATCDHANTRYFSGPTILCTSCVFAPTCTTSVCAELLPGSDSLALHCRTRYTFRVTQAGQQSPQAEPCTVLASVHEVSRLALAPACQFCWQLCTLQYT